MLRGKCGNGLMSCIFNECRTCGKKMRKRAFRLCFLNECREVRPRGILYIKGEYYGKNKGYFK